MKFVIVVIIFLLTGCQSSEAKGLLACKHAGDLMSREVMLNYEEGMATCKVAAKMFLSGPW